MRKTNDEKILRMLQEGKSLQQIANHFGVSKVAVWKRTKKILPAELPESFKKLPHKQQGFVLQMAQGRTQVQAATNSFDVTSPDSAKSIGSELMRKDDIKLALSDLLDKVGMTRRFGAEKMKVHADNADPNVSLKSIDMMWKVRGEYTVEHVHHVVSYADLTKEYRELVKEQRRLKEELGMSDEDIIEAEAIEESEAEEEKGLEEAEVVEQEDKEEVAP